MRSYLLGVACLVVLVTGCGTYVQRATPSPAASLPGASHADVASQGTALPVSGLAAAVGQAPVCQAAASCAAFQAEQIPLDCVRKVPYTNVLVPKGTTFEVVDPSGRFSCVDSGVVVNGKEVLTCHGMQLYAFQLRLRNASCSATALSLGTGQCDDGFGYDAAHQCCAPLGNAPGVITVTVNLGACPLPGP